MACHPLLKSSAVLAFILLSGSACEDFLKYNPPQEQEIIRVRNRASQQISKLKIALVPEKKVEVFWSAWLASLTTQEPITGHSFYAPRTVVRVVGGPQEQQLEHSSWVTHSRKDLLQELMVTLGSTAARNLGNIHFNIQNKKTALGSSNIITSAELNYQTPESESKTLLAQVTFVLAPAGENLSIVSELWVKNQGTLTPQETVRAAQTPADPEEFTFVTKGLAGLALLLGPLEEEYISEENPTYMSSNEVAHSVIEAALPKRILNLKNKIFRIYSPHGLSCVGRVDGFIALARIQPHLTMTEAWKGSTLKAYIHPEKRAMDLWQLSKLGGRSLAATLTTEGECKGAWWAQDSEWPSPAIWQQRLPTKKELSILLEYVRVAPEYRRQQSLFKKNYRSAQYWDSVGESEKRIRIFEDEAGAQFASVLIRAGVDDSCGSPFDPDLWLLFERKSERNYRLVSSRMQEHALSSWPRSLQPVDAEAAFDLNGDGLPEFVGGYDFFRSYGEGYESVLNLAPAYFSSPC